MIEYSNELPSISRRSIDVDPNREKHLNCHIHCSIQINTEGKLSMRFLIKSIDLLERSDEDFDTVVVQIPTYDYYHEDFHVRYLVIERRFSDWNEEILESIESDHLVCSSSSVHQKLITHLFQILLNSLDQHSKLNPNNISYISQLNSYDELTNQDRSIIVDFLSSFLHLIVKIVHNYIQVHTNSL